MKKINEKFYKNLMIKSINNNDLDLFNEIFSEYTKELTIINHYEQIKRLEKCLNEVMISYEKDNNCLIWDILKHRNLEYLNTLIPFD